MENFLVLITQNAIATSLIVLIPIIQFVPWLITLIKIKKASPTYSVKTRKIIDVDNNEFSDVEAIFTVDGNKIENLYVTEIIFYNAGKLDINFERDMSKPLYIIKYDEAVKILSFKYVLTENLLCFEAKYSELRDSIEIMTTSIGHRQGFYIQILHTNGSAKSYKPFSMSGDLQNGNPQKILEDVVFELANSKSIRKTKMSIAVTFIATAIIIAAFLILLLMEISTDILLLISIAFVICGLASMVSSSISSLLSELSRRNICDAISSLVEVKENDSLQAFNLLTGKAILSTSFLKRKFEREKWFAGKF